MQACATMRSGVCLPWMYSSMRLINTDPASEHADELVVIDMNYTGTVVFLDVAARRERVARSPRVDTHVEYRACNAVTNRRLGPAEDAYKTGTRRCGVWETSGVTPKSRAYLN
jgi:hypothetical protein